MTEETSCLFLISKKNTFFLEVAKSFVIYQVYYNKVEGKIGETQTHIYLIQLKETLASLSSHHSLEEGER